MNENMTLREFEEERRQTDLKPAKHLRRIVPRCCATCLHHVYIEGFSLCKRPDGHQSDVEEAFFYVCDLYRRESD